MSNREISLSFCQEKWREKKSQRVVFLLCEVIRFVYSRNLQNAFSEEELRIKLLSFFSSSASELWESFARQHLSVCKHKLFSFTKKWGKPQAPPLANRPKYFNISKTYFCCFLWLFDFCRDNKLPKHLFGFVEFVLLNICWHNNATKTSSQKSNFFRVV